VRFPVNFWETGLAGQVLYLEAEEAGIRSRTAGRKKERGAAHAVVKGDGDLVWASVLADCLRGWRV
jgi:hypothetical protein